MCTPSDVPASKAATLRQLAREATLAGLKDPIVNLLCHRDVPAGRTPLAYAVALNDMHTCRELLAMGADVNAKMENDTALTIAIKNKKRDLTEMVRLLLSKGADPTALAAAGIDEDGDEYHEQLNETMRHWIGVARRVGVQPEHIKKVLANNPPMDRMHECNYAVVGEEPALTLIKRALNARFGNVAAQTKPLVMAFLGPPGHGKTYLTRNLAHSLVGTDNVLEVACGALRDDADLFGSSLGGSRQGDYSSDGRLTAFLRARQDRDNIVFLDEFEKIKGLTSALGWDQAKKMYQAFLEPWQEGTLTDVGARAGRNDTPHADRTPGKIRTSRTVWILTSNWGQDEIVRFAETHKQRVYGSISEADVDWLKKELGEELLKPLLLQQFRGVDRELQALARRIDEIVPFLPFTTHEQMVVADMELRRRLSDYRQPCVNAPEDKKRMLGNVMLKHTRMLTAHATKFYDPMTGATTMGNVAREADGLFITRFAENKLKSPQHVQELMSSDKPPPTDAQLPEMWLHYDEDVGRVGLWEGEPPPPPEPAATDAGGSSGSGGELGGQVHGGDSPVSMPIAPPPPMVAPVNPFG